MRRNRIIIGVLAALAVAGVATVVVIGGSDDTDERRDDGTASDPASPSGSVPVTDGAVALVLDGGALVSSDGIVDVAITAPPGATEVQLSVDPSFVGAPWRPLADARSLELRDGGYQIVFARTRSGDGADPSDVAVAGIVVDRSWDAATASEDGDHVPTAVDLVAADVVHVRIEEGRIVWNDGDDDQVLGDDVDTDALDDVDAWVLEPASSSASGPSVPSVTGVGRISRPIATGLDDGDLVDMFAHDVYLQLDGPLPLDTELRLVGPDGIAATTVDVDPRSSRSSAILVNQVGYRPGDGRKEAYVAWWRGDGVPTPAAVGAAFEVVDEATDRTVLSGTTVAAPDDDRTRAAGDLTRAGVAVADFSELADEGSYRVCVEPLGCSPTFEISETDTWRRVAITVARSAYHQRSGVALGPPYTPLVRPRPFHPDDGVEAERVDLTMIDDPADIGRDDRFAEYPDATTGEIVEGAWGGHFDAGDWNSRVAHLSYLHMAIDLVTLFPETYRDVDLQIPESGDAVPDLIDEGLWDLDLYLRLQAPDGGVPGAVDQSRFGEGDETSWDNDVRLFVTSPDVWSTYQYAAAAARASVALRGADDERSRRYEESALRAMTWAETTWAATRTEELARPIDHERAAAAVAMLALTEDDSWNDVVADAYLFDEGWESLLDCDGPQCNIAWWYLQLPPELVREPMRENALITLENTAEAILADQARSAFPWMMERPDLPLIWGLGPSVPHGIALLRAYVVTGDERYRDAAVAGASFTLGANPLGVSFATGLGTSPVRNPLIVDSISAGLPVWPGTFVFGVHDFAANGADDWIEQNLADSGMRPTITEEPMLRRWVDVARFPQTNEFTYVRSHASALWTMGVLGAT